MMINVSSCIRSIKIKRTTITFIVRKCVFLFGVKKKKKNNKNRWKLHDLNFQTSETIVHSIIAKTNNPIHRFSIT